MVDIVGEENASADELERLVYSHDLASIPREILFAFKIKPDVIVKPKTLGQVVDVLKCARESRVAVTPRGSATWAFGGAMTTQGGVMLDLSQLNKIGWFDEQNGLISVQCGVTWKSLIEFLDQTRWCLPSYPSSAPSATVGGWAATGGLGYGSLKNGYFKDSTVRATVALPTGEMVAFEKSPKGEHQHLVTKLPLSSIGQLRRRLQGLKLEQLFSSEGILCLFLEFTVKLMPRGEVERPVLASFNKFEEAIEASKKVASNTKPFTMILHDDEFLKIKREAGFHAPEAGGILLAHYYGSAVEVESNAEEFLRTASDHGGTGLPEEEAWREWEERFYPMRVKRRGPTLLASDVIIPVNALNEAVKHSRKLAGKSGLRVGIDVIFVSPDEAIFLPLFFSDERHPMRFLSHLGIVKKLNDFVINVGGRPYGYGVWNAYFINRVQPERAAELRRLKRALDPANTLNPGKTYTMHTQFSLPLPLKRDRLRIPVPRMVYSLVSNLLWIIGRFL
ncbi:MAG: FAD-binding oxidoreductase [Candidatus Geothermarchaeales archaeon]